MKFDSDFVVALVVLLIFYLAIIVSINLIKIFGCN